MSSKSENFNDHKLAVFNFRDNIFTAVDYKEFDNKKVVIIGMGNSGGDIAVELGICAKQVSQKSFPCLNKVYLAKQL